MKNAVNKASGLLLLGALLALPAAAQENAAFRDGYNKGYKEAYAQAYKDAYAQAYREGQEAGYRKAQAELAAVAPPPTPPQPQIVAVPVQVAPANYLIQVISALYGPDSGSKRCDATHYVRKQANGQRSINVAITNDMCGDPAPGERKSVQISYTCGTVAKTASAYEHRSAYLSCD